MLEAQRCAGLQAVPVKSVEQQALQALHRVRTQWQATRTNRINVIRGVLREQGYAVPTGARTVLARVRAVLDNPSQPLPALLRHTVRMLVEEVQNLEPRVAAIDRELARVARERASSRSPASGSSPPRRSWAPCPTSRRFRAGETSPAGWASRHENRRPGPVGISDGSANEATATCGAY